MLKIKTVRLLLFVLFLMSASILIKLQASFNSSGSKPLGKGNVTALNRVYQQWQENYQLQGGNQFLTLALNDNKSLSPIHTSSKSEFKINLFTGAYTASVKGLGSGAYYLWLVASNESDSQKKITKFLGQFSDAGDKTHYLKSQLNRTEMQDLYLSRVVISSTTQGPLQNTLLTGSPSLFQKIFYHNQYWMAAKLEPVLQLSNEAEKTASIINELLPKAVYAKSRKHNSDDILSAQIAKGRDLFINETFAGNGRTCSTCHRLDNNHTIDPKYIARLPDDDPLFIAETNPELATLEQPKLLRQFGLVLANIDGFDRPGVLRGVPHLLGLGTSIIPEEEFEGTVVKHALGWSADGAPGDGSLRTFTIGAVMQHMPKTLNREEGVDFRLPTDEELDAL